MSRISPRRAARARPRSDRSTGDNSADHSGFSAIRASATLAGAGCCGDLGASGTRLLHFRKRASWALMPRAYWQVGLFAQPYNALAASSDPTGTYLGHMPPPQRCRSKAPAGTLGLYASGPNDSGLVILGLRSTVQQQDFARSSTLRFVNANHAYRGLRFK
jgi:hypothetical protein